VCALKPWMASCTPAPAKIPRRANHVSPNSQESDDKRLLRWMQRHGRKGAAIRLANRNFRIAWVLLQNDQNYSRQPSRKVETDEIEEVNMHN